MQIAWYFLLYRKITENAGAVGEFSGLILATTVWFEVLTSFYFCHCENREMSTIHQLLNLMAHKIINSAL